MAAARSLLLTFERLPPITQGLLWSLFGALTAAS